MATTKKNTGKKAVKVRKEKVDAAFTEGVQEQESFKEWILAKLDSMFVDNIPMDAIRELPTRYMYLGGSITYIGALVCFIFFLYSGYDTARNTEFISLSETDGECYAVTRENSGIFLATDTGFWEGTEAYSAALAIYKVEFYRLDLTQEEYEVMVNRFQDSIRPVGQKALHYEAAHNIVSWITFELNDPHFLFQMTGNSVDVFDRYYLIGGIASVEGVCDPVHMSSLDGGNSLLRMEYGYTEYVVDKNCMAAVNPVHLGYNANYDHDNFRVDIDLNALVIAVAVCCECLCLEYFAIIRVLTCHCLFCA
jgi:hypothetical protein